jgi:hypothetical protein
MANGYRGADAVQPRGDSTLARIAFMKAHNRNVVLAFNPDAKKHHRGKRKLKREE